MKDPDGVWLMIAAVVCIVVLFALEAWWGR